MLAAKLGAGERASSRLAAGRSAYLFAAGGEIRVNGQLVHERDGVALHDEPEVDIAAAGEAEVVVVEVRD